MRIVLGRPFTLAVSLTGLLALGFIAVLSALGPDWAVYAPASCTATRCFCELPRTGKLLLQPASTWSSFGYVLIGCLMLVQPYRRDPGSALSAISARTLGVTSIIVGVGSGLLHGTLTLWGQFLDVLGMYLVGSFLLISAIARWRRVPDGAAVTIYVTLCAALVTALFKFSEVRRWLFAVLLILAVVTELAFARPFRPSARVALYFGGLIATTIAFGIWILDQEGVLCAPTSLIQGHAVWHLLGAASLWLTFSYYRSERRQPQPH
jgi:dihydroceramidase